MSVPVQSSKIATLYEELGFSGEYPGRDKKVLEAALKPFSFDVLNQGSPLPHYKADSPEAQKLALQFCDKNLRGKTLWPDNAHAGWPQWSTERPKILASIAHIFSLKAFYRYQKILVAKKKEASEVETTPQADNEEHELSAVPSEMTAPVPRKAVNRRISDHHRFPTNAEASREFVPPMISDQTQTNDHGNAAECMQYIESLAQDDKSPLKDFTSKWLADRNRPIPRSADTRILLFMHEKNFYDRDDEDGKILELINRLRKGTKIESHEVGDYNSMEDRVLDRVQLLTKDLRKKKLIVYQDGKAQKSDLFKKYWMNKQKLWQDSASANMTDSNGTRTDIYDMRALPDDTRFTTSSRRAAPSKAPGVIAVESKQTKADGNPLKRNSEIATSKEGHSASPPNKRHRPSVELRNDNEDVAEAFSEADANPIIANFEDNSTNEDLETAELIKFAEEVLSSPTPEVRRSSPRPVTPVSGTTNRPPMTPTSLAGTIDTIASEDQRFTSPEQTLGRATSMESAPSMISPLAASKRGPEIFLTLPNPNGIPDLVNPVPASQLRDSSLSAFFALVSQRSGVSLDDLNSLTFRLSFPRYNEMHVYKDNSDEQWEKLKDNIKRYFKYTRMQDRHKTDFEVFVDIGDDSGVAKKEEDSEETGGL